MNVDAVVQAAVREGRLDAQVVEPCRHVQEVLAKLGISLPLHELLVRGGLLDAIDRDRIAAGLGVPSGTGRPVAPDAAADTRAFEALVALGDLGDDAVAQVRRVHQHVNTSVRLSLGLIEIVDHRAWSGPTGCARSSGPRRARRRGGVPPRRRKRGVAAARGRDRDGRAAPGGVAGPAPAPAGRAVPTAERRSASGSARAAASWRS